jgi:hypothetical protein
MKGNIVLQKARFKALHFRLAGGGCACHADFEAEMTEEAADALGCYHLCYGGGADIGFRKIDLDLILGNCVVNLKIGGVVSFSVEFEAGFLYSFRVFWRKGRPSLSFTAEVQSKIPEVVEFVRSVGAAEGVMKITPCRDAQESLFANGGEDGVTFYSRMADAATADEGRAVIAAHEAAIQSLMEAHGVDPLCGRVPGLGYRGFSVTSKKQRNAAIKALKAVDAEAAARLEELILDGESMEPRWKELVEAETRRAKEQYDDEDQ